MTQLHTMSPQATPHSPTRQVHNLFSAPDWHPTSHPTMPEIVSRGRALTFSHVLLPPPNGQGRPENSSLAGLPPPTSFSNWPILRAACARVPNRNTADPCQ